MRTFLNEVNRILFGNDKPKGLFEKRQLQYAVYLLEKTGVTFGTDYCFGKGSRGPFSVELNDDIFFNSGEPFNEYSRFSKSSVKKIQKLKSYLDLYEQGTAEHKYFLMYLACGYFNMDSLKKDDAEIRKNFINYDGYSEVSQEMIGKTISIIHELQSLIMDPEMYEEYDSVDIEQEKE